MILDVANENSNLDPSEAEPANKWGQFLGELNDVGIKPVVDDSGRLVFYGIRRPDFPFAQTQIDFGLDDDGALLNLYIVDCVVPEVAKGEIGNLSIDFSYPSLLIPRFDNPADIPVIPIRTDTDDMSSNVEGFLQTINLSPQNQADALDEKATMRKLDRTATDIYLWRVEKRQDPVSKLWNNYSVADFRDGKLIRSSFIMYWFPKYRANIPSFFTGGDDPSKIFSLLIDVGYGWPLDNKDYIFAFVADAKPGYIVEEADFDF